MAQQLLILDVPGTQVTPTLGGVYVPNSQHDNVNLSGQQWIRQEIDSNLAALQIRVEYSANGGQSWEELCETAITSTDHSTVSRWFDVPQDARTEVSLRAMAIGTVTCRVRFVEVETR